MNLKSELKYILSDSEKDELLSFYKDTYNFSIEQYFGFPKLDNSNLTNAYFIQKNNDKIVSFTIIEEENIFIWKFAKIQFGPLVIDKIYLYDSIKLLIDIYKELGFSKIVIQPSIDHSFDSEILKIKLSKLYNLKFRIQDIWSSIILDINSSNDEVFSKFSKGHKSAIKQVVKSNLKVVSSSISSNQILQFSLLYEKMWRKQGVNFSSTILNEYFLKILDFSKKQSSICKIYLIENEFGKILGGIIVVYQKSTARYFIGASDFENRTLPIVHYALWEAIIDAKRNNLKNFDFWGYNHFAKEGSALFNINKFKRGFGGDLTFYCSSLVLNFRPLNILCFKIVITINSILKKIF